jgi:SAM-dependent methyltransferase
MHDVTNLLYRHPEWYETVYDGAGHAAARLAEAQFRTCLGRPPASLLDIGCGTGRDLEYFAKSIPDVLGVDYQQSMIDYARRQRPALDLRTGDMRTLRLGRTFEAITSLGLAIANIHANRDIDRVLATHAAHSTAGTVLVLELLDPAKLDRLPARFTIQAPGVHTTSTATYHYDPREQLLHRGRTWQLDGETVHDSVRFRVLYPQELTHYLDRHGFDLRATLELAEEKSAASMFAVAQHRGQA